MNKKKLIIGIVAVIGGLVFAVLGFLPQNANREAAAESWRHLSGGAGKEVEGKVAVVESVVVTEGVRKSRHIETLYCPVYHYTVGAREYEVQSVGDNCKENEDDIVLESTASILYDPEQPAESFVNTKETAAYYGDTSGSQWVAIAGGALIALLGAVVILTSRTGAVKKSFKKEKVDENSL